MGIYKYVDFEIISDSNLIPGAIYRGGNEPNYNSEVISHLMTAGDVKAGNAGGFRKCMRRHGMTRTEKTAYVCIYTNGEEVEWRDEINLNLGVFTYWGDNRKPGNPINNTKPGGNRFLCEAFKLLETHREDISPIFVFQSCGGRDVIFHGLAVPGCQDVNRCCLSVENCRSNDGEFLNYKALFTILDTGEIDRRWLNDLVFGDAYRSEYAPKAWKLWVDQRKYITKTVEKSYLMYRSHNEQIPEFDSVAENMLKRISEYFSNSTDFAFFVNELLLMSNENISDTEISHDRNQNIQLGSGKLRIGYVAGFDMKITIASIWKQLSKPVTVDDLNYVINCSAGTSMFLVCNTFVSSGAYREIIDRELPIVIISRKDIAEILACANIDTLEKLNDWLTQTFWE